MHNRMKELRKALDLTQAQFAERLHVTKSSITNMENGARNITDRSVNDICREFNVNEAWLRKGEGQMFNELSKNQLVTQIVAKAIKSDNEYIKNTLIALAELSEDELNIIFKFIKKIGGQ